MGGRAWDSLGRIGKRDCSVDDDHVKKPDRCSAPTYSCRWDRHLEPGLASFYRAYNDRVRRQPDEAGSSITRKCAIASP
jgi:hypothetical protein